VRSVAPVPRNTRIITPEGTQVVSPSTLYDQE